jgi:hypothetical protein
VLQREPIENIPQRVAADILLLVTADHGHINVAPRQTLYLNRYPRSEEEFGQEPYGSTHMALGQSPRRLFCASRRSVCLRRPTG